MYPYSRHGYVTTNFFHLQKALIKIICMNDPVRGINNWMKWLLSKAAIPLYLWRKLFLSCHSSRSSWITPPQPLRGPGSCVPTKQEAKYGKDRRRLCRDVRLLLRPCTCCQCERAPTTDPPHRGLRDSSSDPQLPLRDNPSCCDHRTPVQRRQQGATEPELGLQLSLIFIAGK